MALGRAWDRSGPLSGGGSVLDGLTGVAAAYSLRRVSSTYNGPCVNIRRSSDSTAQDIGFVGSDLDITAFSAFIGGGSGFVTKEYDQSGNGNHLVQATAANQPQLIPSVAALGGRPGLLFGDSSIFALSAPSVASIDNMFATGGWWSFVCNITGTPTVADRFASKGVNVTDLNIGTTLQITLTKAAATTAGGWVGLPALAATSHIVDLSYSSASLANVPTAFLDSVAQSFPGPTQPVGAITTDVGSALFLGNNSNLNRGFPGHLAEAFFFSSIPANQVVIRANQKAYWGTPTPIIATDLGQATQLGAGPSVTFNLSSSIDVGDVVIVHAYGNGANLLPASGANIVDSGANPYLTAYTAPSPGPTLGCYYSKATVPCLSGSPFTVTFNASGSRTGISVFKATGLAGTIDTAPTTTTATATSAISIASGTLSQARGLLVGCVDTAASPGTLTPGNGFAAIGGSSGNAFVLPAWLATNDVTTVNWAPTWINSILHRSGLVFFKGL